MSNMQTKVNVLINNFLDQTTSPTLFVISNENTKYPIDRYCLSHYMRAHSSDEPTHY